MLNLNYNNHCPHWSSDMENYQDLNDWLDAHNFRSGCTIPMPPDGKGLIVAQPCNDCNAYFITTWGMDGYQTQFVLSHVDYVADDDMFYQDSFVGRMDDVPFTVNYGGEILSFEEAYNNAAVVLGMEVNGMLDDDDPAVIKMRHTMNLATMILASVNDWELPTLTT